MDNIYLHLQNSLPEPQRYEAGETIRFNDILEKVSNEFISFDKKTSKITLKKKGTYFMRWSVRPNTSNQDQNSSFETKLMTSQGESIVKSNSLTNNGIIRTAVVEIEENNLVEIWIQNGENIIEAEQSVNFGEFVISALNVTDYEGITGPTGAAGVAIAQEFSSDSTDYLKGQIISKDEVLYKVNKNDPAGLPGISEDYTALLRLDGVAPVFKGTERTIKNISGYIIPAGGNILFPDSIYDGNFNVMYNEDGIFNLKKAGSYLINWWISVYSAENGSADGLFGIKLNGVQYSSTAFSCVQGSVIVVGNTYVSVNEPSIISLANFIETTGYVLKNGQTQGDILITQVA